MAVLRTLSTLSEWDDPPLPWMKKMRSGFPSLDELAVIVSIGETEYSLHEAKRLSGAVQALFSTRAWESEAIDAVLRDAAVEKWRLYKRFLRDVEQLASEPGSQAWVDAVQALSLPAIAAVDAVRHGRQTQASEVMHVYIEREERRALLSNVLWHDE